MNLKRVIASVMALSIVASGVLSTDASVFSKILQTNVISASAASSNVDWAYEVNDLDSQTVTLTEYNGTDEHVFIPENIDGHTVTELGLGLFNGNTTITRVDIPQTVKKIDYMAFAYTSNLDSVYLSTEFDEMGNYVFFHSGISNISIPSAKAIGYCAFGNCENLKSIKLPNNLKRLESIIFSECINLESVTFPESLTCIGSNSFAGCKSLKSFSLPNNLETLESGAFIKCESLESVTIPESVTDLGDQVFAYCTNLKNATFNSYPKKGLGKKLFLECTALENINIPDDNGFVHAIISTGMVAGCTNFTQVNNEDIVTYEKQRYNPYAKPLMRDDFMKATKAYLTDVDEQRIGFFEEYLKGTIKYIAGINSHNIGSSNVLTTSQKVKALHDWVCNNINYAYDSNENPDPSKECHIDSSVFMRSTTVCDGYARALTLLLREAGIEAYLLYSDTHAWCMVKIDNYYFHVDPCHDDSKYGVKYSHFLVSDKDIKKFGDSHSTWKFASPQNSRINYSLPQMPICERSLGDVYKDNIIDGKDVQLIQDYISNTVAMPDPSNPEFLFADVNCDGKIDVKDIDTIYMLFS